MPASLTKESDTLGHRRQEFVERQELNAAIRSSRIPASSASGPDPVAGVNG
jgi:hypothetical protein